MDKLKNVLAPGHTKDAEILYDYTPKQKSSVDATDGSKKEHGGLKQILKPKGDESHSAGHEQTGNMYDEAEAPAVQPHGNNRHVEEAYQPERELPSQSQNNSLEGHYPIGDTPALAPDEAYPHAKPARNEETHHAREAELAGAGVAAGAVAGSHHEHHKHDSEKTTEHGDASHQKLHTKPKKEHNILRSIFNPKNEKHDSTLYGATATTEPVEEAATPQKEHGVIRQIINPNGERDDSVRRSSVQGTSAAEALPGVSPHDKLETTPEAKKKEHGILRQIFHPHRNQAHDETATTVASDEHNHSKESAIGGGVVAAAAASAGHDRHQQQQHKKLQKKNSRSPRGSQEIAAPAIVAQDYAHQGRATDSQNSPREASIASIASIKSGVMGNPAPKQAGGDLPSIESTDGKFMDSNSLSYDFKTSKAAAAVVAGGAAAGGTTYMHNHDGGHHAPSAQESVAPTHIKPTDTGPAKHTIGPHKSDILNVIDPRVRPDPAKQKASKTAEAKAATGPAEHTIGTHKSDALNVVDPRVQPQWDQMKPAKTAAEHEATGPAPNTIGPHKSDAMNVLDPRVQPEPDQMKANVTVAHVPRSHGPPEHATSTAASATETPTTYSGATVERSVAQHQDSNAAHIGSSGLPRHENPKDTADGKGGIIHGERGAKGDVSNPYSATPLDPRLMPGAYPPTPSAGQ